MLGALSNKGVPYKAAHTVLPTQSRRAFGNISVDWWHQLTAVDARFRPYLIRALSLTGAICRSRGQRQAQSQSTLPEKLLSAC